MKDNNCKLSLIIPHYNASETLRDLLNSIGIHNEVEIIVVDDKSESSLELLRREYTHVHFLENNTVMKGPGTARNIGLDVASGEWILFADSDDVFVDDWYRIVSSCYQYEQDVVYFPPESVDLNTGEVNTKRGKWYTSLCRNYINNGDEELLRSKFSVPWSKLIKKSLIETYGIRFDEIMHWEDSMFSARIGYLAKSVTVCPESIYRVIDSSGSMTTINTEEAMSIRTRVLCEQYKFWKGKTGYKRTLRILKNDGLNLLKNNRSLGLGFMIKQAWFMCKSGLPVPIIGFMLIIIAN